METISENMFSGLVLLILLVHLIITAYYLRRQANALKAQADFEEQRFWLGVKNMRDAVTEKSLPGGAYGWLAEQVKQAMGYNVSFEQEKTITLGTTPVLVAQTDAGDTLVVSPLPRRQLIKRLNNLINNAGRLAELTEESIVLMTLRKAKKQYQRSLTNAGAYFDIEARKADEEIGVGWGQAEELFFQWVMG